MLLHGLVDRDLIGEIHLVELVNGANAIVCEHKSAGLDRKFTCFFVTDDSGRETCRRRRLARRIYGARHETTHIFEELRFARAGIAHDANVDVATQMNAVLRLLVYATEELEQNALFDNFMAIHGGGNTANETRIDICAGHHDFELLALFFREIFQNRLSVFFVVVSDNIGASVITLKFTLDHAG